VHLIQSCLPLNHFSHIFVDESSQALEPELFIPLSLANPSTSIILAGDHKQLGPPVHSKVAANLGLKMSLQERLLRFPLYDKAAHHSISPNAATSTNGGAVAAGPSPTAYPRASNLNPRFVTKLRKNYRSHPALLKVPSELFYDDELIAAAHPAETHSLLGWPLLPNPSFPFLFYGVVGQDCFEPESSSFYNDVEASKVLIIIKELLAHRIRADDQKVGASSPSTSLSTQVPSPPSPPMSASSSNPTAVDASESSSAAAGHNGAYTAVSPNDIGVIAPFRKQVNRIRLLLRAHGLGAIRVGVTEDYQGQEEKIIIISTVISKSRPHLNASSPACNVDTDMRVGILRNEKRFNVSLSRAKALCVVVGNPFILKDEPHWRHLLNYCIRNNGYSGVKPPLLNSLQSHRLLPPPPRVLGALHEPLSILEPFDTLGEEDDDYEDFEEKTEFEENEELAAEVYDENQAAVLGPANADQ